jgi:hypothetical protein
LAKIAEEMTKTAEEMARIAEKMARIAAKRAKTAANLAWSRATCGSIAAGRGKALAVTGQHPTKQGTNGKISSNGPRATSGIRLDHCLHAFPPSTTFRRDR